MVPDNDNIDQRRQQETIEPGINGGNRTATNTDEVMEEHLEMAGSARCNGDDDCTTTNRSAASKSKGPCYRFMTRIGCEWIARLPQDWPRSFALLFGVVVPILSLIAVSLFFGYFLADLEASNEIEANNDVIANRASVALFSDFVGNLTTQIPRICLQIYLLNQTIQGTLQEAVDEVFTKAREPFNASQVTDEINGVDVDDVQDLFRFTRECGELAWTYASSYEKFTGLDATDLGSISFNWIRCDGEANSTAFNSIFGNYVSPPYSNLTNLRPDVQEAKVVADWNKQQKQLYAYYFQEYSKEMGPVEARSSALKMSYEEASGFDFCNPNSAAGAWFWFTVMTTIGYGNTAPSTDGGRAMVFTLGFFSILCFALVLGKAGTIVTTIFDDAVNRTRLLSRLTIPWVACIFWGSFYYGWMVIIAGYTHYWKEARLDEEFLFKDAYWFSFITTTTVGLGDYFLEHEVLLRRDLVVFALFFLFGFVLLANFLVKLTELVVGLFPRNKPTLQESLDASDTGCCCCPKIPLRSSRKKMQSGGGEEEEIHSETIHDEQCAAPAPADSEFVPEDASPETMFAENSASTAVDSALAPEDTSAETMFAENSTSVDSELVPEDTSPETMFAENSPSTTVDSELAPEDTSPETMFAENSTSTAVDSERQT